MFVAQVTEPSEQGEHNEQYEALQRRFPEYNFSVMMSTNPSPFIICKPVEETVMFPSDEGVEVEILRHIVTVLIGELITGHMITDR